MRDAVFKVLKGFLSKVEKVSEDPSLKEQMGEEMLDVCEGGCKGDVKR